MSSSASTDGEYDSKRDLLHLQGRAFDLELRPSKNPRREDQIADHVISRLGELAYRNTQFQYVRFDSHGFLHVSCPCSGN